MRSSSVGGTVACVAASVMKIATAIIPKRRKGGRRGRLLLPGEAVEALARRGDFAETGGPDVEEDAALLAEVIDAVGERREPAVELADERELVEDALALAEVVTEPP